MMFAQIKLYLYGAVLIAFLALGAYSKYLLGQNDQLHKQLELQNIFAEQQNNAVEKFKSDAAVRLKKAEVSLAAAQKVAVAAKAKSVVIYRTIPSVPGDACTSALDLANSK